MSKRYTPQASRSNLDGVSNPELWSRLTRSGALADLGRTSQAALGFLWSFMGKPRSLGDGSVRVACWPSQAALAEALGCSRRTVGRAIRELAAAGLVEVVRRSRCNLYRMRFRPAERPAKSRGDQTREPDGTDQQGRVNHPDVSLGSGVGRRSSGIALDLLSRAGLSGEALRGIWRRHPLDRVVEVLNAARRRPWVRDPVAWIASAFFHGWRFDDPPEEATPSPVRVEIDPTDRRREIADAVRRAGR